MVAPTKEVSRQVAQFLRAAGATKVQNHRDMIKMTASVSVIEQMLQTTLYNFQHKESTYSLPLFLPSHLLLSPFSLPPSSLPLLLFCILISLYLVSHAYVIPPFFLSFLFQDPQERSSELLVLTTFPLTSSCTWILLLVFMNSHQ